TEDSSKQVQDFISRFKATYGGEVPDGLAAMGYDAALVMIDAMKRAGTTDGAKLREALASTKDYPGVTGKITIDAQRNAVKSAVVLKVAGGTFKYQTTVNPM
ncbi:MAG: ABC transporter substrate-binding protein, partial [Bdellovibrionota bacterium]